MPLHTLVKDTIFDDKVAKILSSQSVGYHSIFILLSGLLSIEVMTGKVVNNIKVEIRMNKLNMRLG